MKKDFLSILDITKTELDEILTGAERLKRQKRAGVPHELLRGMSLAMIFEKSSTRTHISFEVGHARTRRPCALFECKGPPDRQG